MDDIVADEVFQNLFFALLYYYFHYLIDKKDVLLMIEVVLDDVVDAECRVTKAVKAMGAIDFI